MPDSVATSSQAPKKNWPIKIAVLSVLIVLAACDMETLKNISMGSSRPAQTQETAPRSGAENPSVNSAAAGYQDTLRRWKPLTSDGLHDPDNPGLKFLQHPAEALSLLPEDDTGNMVNWVAALEQGTINPRTNIQPETKINILDLDIFLSLNGSLPIVRFPHRQHTMWLDCENCHDRIFKKKAGATPITMSAILEGEFCGQCHGAVAFPLTECSRCHSVRHGDFKRVLAETENKVVVRPK